MPVTLKSLWKAGVSNPLGSALEAMGMKKNYSYYQNYLRNIPGEQRFEISNTEYLNATKRAKKGQANYLNYLKATRRNNRAARPYEAWKRTKEVMAAPVEYTENPMRRGLASGTTISTMASNPVNSRAGSPQPDGGRRKTRRHRRRHSRRRR